MKFWLGLSACLLLATAGVGLLTETEDGHAVAPGRDAPLAPRSEAPLGPSLADARAAADRSDVPRQMQVREILARTAGKSARTAGDPARPAGDPARPAGDPARPAADPARDGGAREGRPAQRPPDEKVLRDVRAEAEQRVGRAQAALAESARRLEQEETRATLLSDDLLVVRRELIAARTEAADLRARAALGAEEAEARAASGTEEARRAADAAVAAARQALAEERTRAAAVVRDLARDLAEARRRSQELEAATLAEGGAASDERAADAARRAAEAQDREAREAALRRLDRALRVERANADELSARLVQVAAARDRAEWARAAAERSDAETRGRLDRLRLRVDALSTVALDAGRAAPDRAAAPQAAGLAVPPPLLPDHPASPLVRAMLPMPRPPAEPDAGAGAPRPADRIAEALPPAAVDEDRLLARVGLLLRHGDISGARLLLQHAMRAGSARATVLLAETYDPARLTALQVRGLQGDPAKAGELYRRAQQLPPGEGEHVRQAGLPALEAAGD
ncbi:hypothetical protein OPKNFCMD_5402 [Methylobacterium crusticola]|uniref:TolA protein n=1 Tax=Methylobacterium crusticola TaxID=1697972 RepID=A0ABQ4R4L8_9HYPH|nr:hypothetical protein [Methylobacterium crusticola]GJD52636.1 hypothetical protein OPKNFCMD_5402 [Methylobacterium crusticola]